MEEKAALLQTVKSSIEALGRGFDVNYDTRLLYCKGVAGSQIVEIDEEHGRDLMVFEGLVVTGVSRDVRCSTETPRRETAGAWSFDEMNEYFNRKALLPGNHPLGSFNSAFSFTASKKIDAALTKSLALDGIFIPLCKFQMVKQPSLLHEDVRHSVPLSWDPSSLARFIESYGTHAITSITIGGKDVIYVKQQSSSPLSSTEIKSYIQDIGDHRFSNNESRTSSGPMPLKDRAVDPFTFNSQGIYPQPPNTPCLTAKEVPRFWAPVQNDLPGHQRKEPVCPFLQFSMMGQKLYVSQEQVSVGRKPVIGLRLYLGGTKQNRLTIQVQHLSSLPKILQPYWDTHVAIGPPKWQGPEEQDSRWFEPVKWKKFSHVSTAPIEVTEAFFDDFSSVYIVTGAQLGVWDFGSKNVLYMKLLYSKLPGCTIRRSLWDYNPLNKESRSSGCDSSSSVVGTTKFVKVVDTSEVGRGPQDTPGHWLVTGGKLGVEKGKIGLRLKYSLLNY